MELEDYFEIDGIYELVDGLYNVSGDVLLIKEVEKLPFSFGKVSGNFDCSYNRLTSIEGSPYHVGFCFNCIHNFNLKSLKGLPTHIGKLLLCNNNLKVEQEYKQYLIMKKLRT
tara:strand:- start:1116 stop:1454 length:339 start_codon:yes stop_codon:yes gene_type:complete